ncbi:MAG: hypothetical protein RIT02_4195 [Planctomycetota bacterium]
MCVAAACKLKVGDVIDAPLFGVVSIIFLVAVTAVSAVIGLHGDEAFVEGGSQQLIPDQAVKFQLEGSIGDVRPLAAGVFYLEIWEPVLLQHCQQCEQQAVAGLTARFGADGAPVGDVRIFSVFAVFSSLQADEFACRRNQHTDERLAGQQLQGGSANRGGIRIVG